MTGPLLLRLKHTINKRNVYKFALISCIQYIVYCYNYSSLRKWLRNDYADSKRNSGYISINRVYYGEKKAYYQ